MCHKRKQIERFSYTKIPMLKDTVNKTRSRLEKKYSK